MTSIEELDKYIDDIRRAARLPGCAISVVANGEMVMANAYGYRDLEARLPMTPRTRYPIGSTTKAMTAALLGLLVEEGRLNWDDLVRDYIPSFALMDSTACAQVTVRDLLTMRVGLPRHDFSWVGTEVSRRELIEHMAWLPLSAAFRRRFQYSNLSYVLAGHIAETVRGISWEEDSNQRLFRPLVMRETGVDVSSFDELTVSYKETPERQLIRTTPMTAVALGPAGTTVYSTVEDMAQWCLLNLDAFPRGGEHVLNLATLRDIHAPVIPMCGDPAAPSPDAAYGMGWFVDYLHRRRRVSHTGYWNDIDSAVMLFPDERIGITVFTNFGAPRCASIIAQVAFEILAKMEHSQTVQERLAKYENCIATMRARRRALEATAGMMASTRNLESYAGTYSHPGYGEIEVTNRAGCLEWVRGSLRLQLTHLQHDSWMFESGNEFAVEQPFPIDWTKAIRFEAEGKEYITALEMLAEPAVGPVAFAKRIQSS